MNNNKENPIKDDDFLYGMPLQEIEEPLDTSPSKIAYQDPTLINLKIKQSDKKRDDLKYFSAFKLIVGCLALLLFILIIDILVNACIKKEVSTLTESVVEIIKTLLFTLSGYLFAKRESSDT